jgi:hypothetical protein
MKNAVWMWHSCKHFLMLIYLDAAYSCVFDDRRTDPSFDIKVVRYKVMVWLGQSAELRTAEARPIMVTIIFYPWSEEA